jgi:hypothetical protein
MKVPLAKGQVKFLPRAESDVTIDGSNIRQEGTCPWQVKELNLNYAAVSFL